MFCVFCGTKLPDDAKFCSGCGKAAVKPEVTQKSGPEDVIGPGETGSTPESNVSEEAFVVEEAPASEENAAQIAVVEKNDALQGVMARARNKFPENTGNFNFVNTARYKLLDQWAVLKDRPHRQRYP